jgi:hypothetical protein
MKMLITSKNKTKINKKTCKASARVNNSQNLNSSENRLDYKVIAGPPWMYTIFIDLFGL